MSRANELADIAAPGCEIPVAGSSMVGLRRNFFAQVRRTLPMPARNGSFSNFAFIPIQILSIVSLQICSLLQKVAERPVFSSDEG